MFAQKKQKKKAIDSNETYVNMEQTKEAQEEIVRREEAWKK
jgi:hypothetical protein